MTRVLTDINYESLRRGFDEVEYEGDGDALAWPRCEISGCPHGICIGMSKSLCYPHGIEFGAFTKEEFDRSLCRWTDTNPQPVGSGYKITINGRET